MRDYVLVCGRCEQASTLEVVDAHNASKAAHALVGCPGCGYVKFTVRVLPNEGDETCPYCENPQECPGTGESCLKRVCKSQVGKR